MAIPTTPPARRLRLGLPRRVFSQVLPMQVAIAAGVAVLATGLFLAPLGEQLDDQTMRRAHAIAQTTAAQPQVAEDVVRTSATPDRPVQREAEHIREATGVECVVVMDRRGVRWSHTGPRAIGGTVSTDPSQALAGHEVMEIYDGALGRSARGKVSAATEPDLPKGPFTTAELVRQALMDADGPLSAQEIAERTGLSRQTAQRCLKLLERTGRATPTLEYGDAART